MLPLTPQRLAGNARTFPSRGPLPESHCANLTTVARCSWWVRLESNQQVPIGTRGYSPPEPPISATPCSDLLF